MKMKKLRHVDISRFSFKWEDFNEQAIFNESSETILLENLKTFRTCSVLVDEMVEVSQP